MRIFIHLWLKSIRCYMTDQLSAHFHSVVTYRSISCYMIDQLWSGMLLFLSAAASNAGRQIWMKIIYIILHSLNSKCKTSLVDMKLPVSVVLEWWSSIGRNWQLLRSITVFWYSPTLLEIIIFCFFTMLHVSGSFFIVELEYLEPKVVLCHTLVTDHIVTSMTTCLCRAEK